MAEQQVMLANCIITFDYVPDRDLMMFIITPNGSSRLNSKAISLFKQRYPLAIIDYLERGSGVIVDFPNRYPSTTMEDLISLFKNFWS